MWVLKTRGILMMAGILGCKKLKLPPAPPVGVFDHVQAHVSHRDAFEGYFIVRAKKCPIRESLPPVFRLILILSLDF